MAVAETARLALYCVEWIWTVVVLGIIPSQLVKRAQPLKDGSGTGDVCGLNWSLGLSRCNFGIAWAAIAFSILTIAIVWHLMVYCSSIDLRYNVEMVLFAWLTIWWFVGAITLTAVKSGKAPRSANIVVAFAWMLVFFSVASAVLAVKTAPKLVGASNSASEDSADEREHHGDSYA